MITERSKIITKYICFEENATTISIFTHLIQVITFFIVYTYTPNTPYTPSRWKLSVTETSRKWRPLQEINSILETRCNPGKFYAY